jgi:hypothetical protein
MRGRRVRDARNNEHHVCARRREGEPAGSLKTGSVAYYTRPPQARQDALLPEARSLSAGDHANGRR